MKVKSIAECSPWNSGPLGAFCNTFELHKAIIGLENQFVVFLRVAFLHRFYCIFMLYYSKTWKNWNFDFS